MTQTEKARAYEEALERARKLKENPQNVFNEYSPKEGDTICDYIFPELKESEDEKIRKAIIEGLRAMKSNFHTISSIKIDDAINWLEKQGEQKPIIEMITPEESLGIDSETYNEIVNTCIFGENKPKFKVGDWIVNRLGNIWHIDSFNANNYQVTTTKGEHNYFPINIQDRMHLWTIADAKDGDILCTPNGNTFIFKTIDGDKILDYCGLYFNKFFSDSGSPNGSSTHYDKCNYHPATKEQCDLLFQKMKEAGYEWDAEKKELKRIEYKHICELDNSYACVTFPFKAKVKSSGAIVTIHGGQLSHDGKEWIKYQSDAEDGYKVYEPNNLELVCEIEQKPAWSEEDETIISALSQLLKDCELENNWNCVYSNDREVFFVDIVNWLKSLKDRVIPQSKQEWSEEDENILQGIWDEILANKHNAKEYEWKTYDKFLDWLKSIKQRICE